MELREKIPLGFQATAGDSGDLYSTSLRTRLDNTRKLPEQGIWPSKHGRQPKWPWGNHGAANAFSVLVGPSPGAAPSDGKRHEHAASCGPMSGFHGFTDEPHRNVVWPPLAEASFGESGNAVAHRALGALFNLSSENQSDASLLNLSDRDADECVTRLQSTRPIIVVALTSEVFVRLHAAWTRIEATVTQFSGPANRQRKSLAPLPAAVVEWSWLGTTSTRTLLVKAPRHPSHPDKLASGVSSMSAEGVVMRWQVLRETVTRFLGAENALGGKS